MAEKTINFKESDPVIVKPKTTDPDFGTDISGWQGRISEIDEENHLICIDWDSITLKNMPGAIIEQSEEQGLSWTQMFLEPEEVEFIDPRDTEEDVEDAIDDLESKYAWSYLGEEGKRIQAVLADVDPYDEWEAFEAWEEHLRDVLTFPFEAEVVEFQERGRLRQMDRVRVLGITEIFDLYGVIVKTTHKQRGLEFPLCDLEAIDKTSENYRHVKDYAVWFANR